MGVGGDERLKERGKGEEDEGRGDEEGGDGEGVTGRRRVRNFCSGRAERPAGVT